MEAVEQDTKEIATLKKINVVSEDLGMELRGLSGLLLLLVEADGLSPAAGKAMGFLCDVVETMATKADEITNLSVEVYTFK